MYLYNSLINWLIVCIGIRDLEFIIFVRSWDFGMSFEIWFLFGRIFLMLEYRGKEDW